MKRYVLSEDGCKNNSGDFCSCRPPCDAGACLVDECDREAQALVSGSSVFHQGEKVMLLEDGVLDAFGVECDVWVCTWHADRAKQKEPEQ